MPVFEYQCKDCKTTYDVYHKGREVGEDIICPSCRSTKHTRLISAPSVAMKSGAGDLPAAAPPCASGGCCGGGACDFD